MDEEIEEDKIVIPKCGKANLRKVIEKIKRKAPEEEANKLIKTFMIDLWRCEMYGVVHTFEQLDAAIQWQCDKCNHNATCPQAHEHKSIAEFNQYPLCGYESPREIAEVSNTPWTTFDGLIEDNGNAGLIAELNKEHKQYCKEKCRIIGCVYNKNDAAKLELGTKTLVCDKDK